MQQTTNNGSITELPTAKDLTKHWCGGLKYKLCYYYLLESLAHQLLLSPWLQVPTCNTDSRCSQDTGLMSGSFTDTGLHVGPARPSPAHSTMECHGKDLREGAARQCFQGGDCLSTGTLC